MKEMSDDRSCLSSMSRWLFVIVGSLVPGFAIHAIETKEIQQSSEATERITPSSILQDLVLAEAAHTLRQMQHADAARLPSSGGFNRPQERHEVRSIYGVGTRLYAELVLSSKPYVFLSGQSHPIQGPDRQWRLQRIQPPCIHLIRDDNPTVLCLGVSTE